ncbi:MAG: type II toxin-antitoxin system RelE/ParE family toxin [Chloroflexi bacterium]|nr:type II toxin-antitoxin system RelE/ParE family toxin [Chloroflexota bacterium]
MAKWLIRTFTTDAGGKPVDDWIRSLDASARAEVIWTVDLLKRHGTALTMPFVRHLGDGIWELRASDQDGIYRVVYFHWKGRTFGLLHGFTKKTRATPRQDLDLAKSRRAAWLNRTAKRG